MTQKIGWLESLVACCRAYSAVKAKYLLGKISEYKKNGGELTKMEEKWVERLEDKMELREEMVG